MFKFNNKSTRTTSLTSCWCFIGNFENISHLFLLLMLLTLSMYLLVKKVDQNYFEKNARATLKLLPCGNIAPYY